MANKRPRPGRTLLIFLTLLGAAFGLLVWNGEYSPKLGLDLQGGTRITLEATTLGGDSVDPEKLEEARAIIDSRVNGSGVAEAEVSVQGDRNIVVEIPGENRRDLVDAVRQTAQLRFRLVAGQDFGLPIPPEAQTPSPSVSPSDAPSDAPSDEPSTDPSEAPSAEPSDQIAPSGSPTASPRGRAPAYLDPAAAKTPKPKPSKAATTPAATTPAPTAPTATIDPAAAPGAPIDRPLQWMDNPGGEWIQKFTAFTCPLPGEERAPVADDPKQPLLACDENGVKYLLSAAPIQGTQLTDASAGIPQNDVQYVVDLSFDSTARKTFGDITRQLAGTGKQFAIVLDSEVISAPEVISPILGGNAQISGDFTQVEAEALATSLRYGALPLKFTVPVITDEGPTLAADQLSAGLTAGAVGLGLVMIYCLFYYRGLGVVVLLSLIVAAGSTYAAVIFLSETFGFTLTLPGIAGLIVAVGITADSFVVFFERIRDEMRDGKSMRVAVEAGWKRARNTCLAADAVSLLAAVVLYIFAIGVVKGFAFALGISTLVDLVVFFWFTKPAVSWLGKFSFFNQGHKLSGLDAENLGVDRLPGLTRRAPVAGGNA